MTKRKVGSLIAEELCTEVNRPIRESPKGLPKIPEQSRPIGGRDEEVDVAVQRPSVGVSWTIQSYCPE